MARKVQIAAGKSNIQLPNGNSYNAGQTVVLSEADYKKIPSSLFPGTIILLGSEVSGADLFAIPVTLSAITGNIDVLTNFVPGTEGAIAMVQFIVTEPVTTAAKLATITPFITPSGGAAAAVTGGVLALTSANATPLGKVLSGTAITAANTFGPLDSISFRATAVTAFTEGRGVLVVTFQSTYSPPAGSAPGASF